MIKEVDEILVGDCRTVLTDFPEDYFSGCITDPPYNYEFIGKNWDDKEISRRVERVKDSKTLVKNIPYGSGLAGGVRNKRWYTRIRENIQDYRSWCEEWSREVFRTLRPGAFALVFNSTRTIAHVQVALESAGFYTRDILVYRRNSGIPKGLNAAKKLEKLGDENWAEWSGWHSCLRNEWEAICLVQKPLIDNYVKTIRASKVGLLYAECNGAGFQSNILEQFKQSRSDAKLEHCTVKPLDLMEFLVRLTIPTADKHIVLDPFAGSGTTCLAAKNVGQHYIGIEINRNYAEIARERINSASESKTQLECF